MKLIYIINKAGKRKLIIFLGLMYIFTFIIFGLLYWRIANVTSGDFFIFKEDINTDIKISEFKKNMNLHNNNWELNRAIKNLIINKEYNRDISKISEKGTIGENWANYYYYLFKIKGATHFTLEEVQEKNSKQNGVKVKIKLYNIESNEEIAVVYAFFMNYPFDKGIYPGNCYYPLDIYFNNVIENSAVYLDQSPVYMKNIVQGKYYYSFWNFMYFSVVTITTLGYGDILPNSSVVRILVMLESISGVIIMGMFASCIFWNKK